MPKRGRKAQLKKARAESYNERQSLRQEMANLGIKRRERTAFKQQVMLGLTPTVPKRTPGPPPKLKERHPKPRTPPPPVDTDPMNLKPLPKGRPVRVYRVEVQSFSEKYPHVNVHGDHSRVDLFTANKPVGRDVWFARNKKHGGVDERGEPSYVSAVGKGKKTPRRNDPHFIDKFLRSYGRVPQGNRTFYNFGEPTRAMHFYKQKSTNPTEIQQGNVFQVKSFQVPYEVFQRVKKDAVHERDAGKHPLAPLNVDRKAPNQFGLPQAYTRLLEAMQIKGSARVHKPETLRRRLEAREKLKKL